ncbi:hypothetical protein CJD36_019975 [Flavipsychrobacter stenotrophus]|uniref:ASCH domain-containing protein n=1 Tax=Flavipsychrobacter stenotrophus TaxID=2077091 RepID=A0A2S7SRI8_9BACT|nr:hypothetical protein [Flavipsychrobacter stenotrophus]PQJ09519.1 hypothetical protein CJD36_019975 [Flavipsychrobacter stenotrophus]
MILGFKKPFKPKLMDGSKLHSMREDKPGRWKVGMKIQMATGVRTKAYECFRDDLVVTRLQHVEIRYYGKVPGEVLAPVIIVDSKRLDDASVLELARNDGFKTMGEFMEWFDEDFEGKIIHWTDFKY